MSSPSFLVRLRTRTRRQDGAAALALPEDHWHSGDPRVLDGSLAMRVRDVREVRDVRDRGDVPVPRRSPDRSPRQAAGQRPELTVVPEIDVRGSVVDLRRAARSPASPAPAPSPSPSLAANPSPVPPAGEPPWNEPSTWLG